MRLVYFLATELKKTPDEIRTMSSPDFVRLLAYLLPTESKEDEEAKGNADLRAWAARMKADHLNKEQHGKQCSRSKH